MTQLFVSIDSALSTVNANLALGVVEASVEVTTDNPALWAVMDQEAREVQDQLKLEDLPQLPGIRTLRETYRALGKDPSRYRGSQEALLRRILQGKGLYRINNVVDINNLTSLRTRHSVGSYDLGRLQSPIVFRVGRGGESYQGIGKETINIEGLPVFVDASGPFGSPTSDSRRAMITAQTRHLMMVIISFTGSQSLFMQMEDVKALIKEYAKGREERMRTWIVP